jgi:hypothetical protein
MKISSISRQGESIRFIFAITLDGWINNPSSFDTENHFGTIDYTINCNILVNVKELLNDAKITVDEGLAVVAALDEAERQAGNHIEKYIFSNLSLFISDTAEWYNWCKVWQEMHMA